MAKKITQTSDVFTALLALAAVSVLATAVYVGLTCLNYYGTLFSIAKPPLY